MHTIRLNKASFFAHHGVEPSEQQGGGWFEVDVSMDVDFEGAARGDDLQRTVDYAAVYRLAEEIVKSNRFRLLERLARTIAHRVLSEFPIVLYVEVAVRKLNPPIGGKCSSAEAVFRSPRLSTT